MFYFTLKFPWPYLIVITSLAVVLIYRLCDQVSSLFNLPEVQFAFYFSTLHRCVRARLSNLHARISLRMELAQQILFCAETLILEEVEVASRETD